jgi:hypothetical protein
MNLLFDEVRKLKEQGDEINKLKEQVKQLQSSTFVQNIETQNNHFNTDITFNIVGFGTLESRDAIVKLLQAKATEILNRPRALDVPYVDQMKERVYELVELVHRNPDHKELQNIYVTSTDKDTDNALVYEDGGWVIGDWSDRRKEMLSNLYFNLKKSGYKESCTEQDTLQMIKQIFVLCGCGTYSDIQKIPDKEVKKIYLELCSRLGFETINL